MELAVIVIALIALVGLAFVLGGIRKAFEAMLTKDDSHTEIVEYDND